MSEFRVGQTVRLGNIPFDDDQLRSIRDRNLAGVIEDVFTDGDLQIRFKDGSVHDAVHWVAANTVVPAAAPEPSADDVRVAEIREWVSSIWAEDEFEYVANDVRYLLSRLDALEAQNAALVKALRNALKQGYDAYRMTPGIHTASFAEWCGEDYPLVEATVEESDDDAG